MTGSILWLKGWSMPASTFEPLIALLPDYAHIAPDYSSAGTPEEMLGIVEQAAGSPALRRPLIIVGWSLGATLALRLADQGLADGLVLVAGNARFVRPKVQLGLGWPDAHLRHMIASIAKNRQDAESAFRQLLLSDSEKGSGLEALLPPAGSWSSSALIAGLELLRREDRLSRLPAVACQVLIIHGREDRVCPFGAAEELYGEIPNAALLPMPGCGHMPFLGREREIIEAVRRWLLGEQDSEAIQSKRKRL
ncbi:alpha/beta hydrolase [Paenibacillus sp. LHD-117]|uniref:alpha/beta fold hydrolase n=1 Tax=Paenibacillus sp. LHD-117 TaxID=3071412 RepID=UPI0027E1CE64|nr:alpha/beta hydrolase [Paenibacillus sp. LHD-117]MDQ6419614.1 alpha/beta hydrolase [Paenibacillus sp. LHD-117]